jgi:hypothetical protein
MMRVTVVTSGEELGRLERADACALRCSACAPDAPPRVPGAATTPAASPLASGARPADDAARTRLRARVPARGALVRGCAD